MSILAVLQVAQAYSGPHNVMSALPSRMLVDDRYATMACQHRLILNEASSASRPVCGYYYCSVCCHAVVKQTNKQMEHRTFHMV